MKPSESYQERFDRVLGEKELISIQRWDGENGWGRTTLLQRRIFAALMALWFLVVIVFGFFKIIIG